MKHRSKWNHQQNIDSFLTGLVIIPRNPVLTSYSTWGILFPPVQVQSKWSQKGEVHKHVLYLPPTQHTIDKKKKQMERKNRNRNEEGQMRIQWEEICTVCATKLEIVDVKPWYWVIQPDKFIGSLIIMVEDLTYFLPSTSTPCMKSIKKFEYENRPNERY